MAAAKTYRIVTLPGDGIGPDVLREAMRVLGAVAKPAGFAIEETTHLVGGAAIDGAGNPFPDATRAACLAADAVMLGAVGGPAWDHHTGAMRPESGLLALRKALGAYANLRPVAVPEALVAASPLRPEVVRGTDMLIVRELTGGIYFGEPRGREVKDGRRSAHNTMVYDEHEIARIATIAFEWARRRRGKVTLVDKANVLVVSQLWREVVPEVHKASFSDIELDTLYVDNAAMQIVLRPAQFDVVLTGNLFGDILSDLAATLPGSLGMLPSASLGSGIGLFEPVHGSAPDIAGQNKANPLAAILSAAMLLDALGEATAAEAVRAAVDDTLAEGLRTGDLWREGFTRVGTTEMGERVATLARKRLEHVPIG
ncbi:MAG: 3-isopropylmalate dehydrogenase [Rhodothermales bacterium]